MAEPDKRPVTMEELLVSSLAQTDALAKLLIEKGLITQEEFMQQISEERTTYQMLLNPAPQKACLPSQDAHYEIRSREIDSTSNAENPGAYANHQRRHC